MHLALPWPLVSTYAFLQVFQYITLKEREHLLQDPNNSVVAAAVGLVLLLSVVLGWGSILLLAYKIGILRAAAVGVIAFVASLPLQVLVLLLTGVLGRIGALIVLFAMPLCAIGAVVQVVHL